MVFLKKNTVKSEKMFLTLLRDRFLIILSETLLGSNIRLDALEKEFKWSV